MLEKTGSGKVEQAKKTDAEETAEIGEESPNRENKPGGREIIRDGHM